MLRLCALCSRALTLFMTLVALLLPLAGCDGGFAASSSLDITAALPPLGPREGGSRVALRGRGFVAGAQVYFDGVAASEIELTAETELRLTVPPRRGAPGPVEIVVETPDQRRTARGGLYTYYAVDLVAEPVLSPPVEPHALAALDLNRDGAAELVLARQSPPGLSIVMSNGKNPPTVVEQALGIEPSSLAVADINGDGLADLLVGDTAHAEVWLLFGRSDGRLSSGAPVPLGCTPNALHSADVTGDGRPDVVVGCKEQSRSAFVLRNQYAPGGVAAFASPVPLSGVPGPVALAVADWNGDGHRDVALVSARAASLQIFLNQGGGSFVGGAAQPLGQTPISVLALDVSQDGRLDLVSADAGTDSIAVLLGDGAGRFLPATPVTLGYTPGAVAALDWNSDGMPDLAIANRDGSEVGIELGIGGGIFQVATAIVTNDPVDVLLAFFPDGSGAPALAAAGRRSRRVSVFRKGISPSSPNSLSEQLYATRPAPRAPLAADLTNDGRVDVAWVEGERITLLPAAGDGSFEAATSLYTLSPPTSLASGDWNSDQLADLAATTASGHSLFLSRGPGQLQAPFEIAAPAPLVRVLGADLDQDGRLDLISSSAGAALRIQFGNGNGTFRPGFDVDMGGTALALGVGDLDGDSRRDLVVMTETEVRARLGLADGGFGDVKVHGSFGKLSALAAADLNLDGVRDLVLGDEGGRVFLLLGRGDGSFVQAQSVATSGPVRYLVVLDLDRDGNLDVALTEEGSSILRVLLGKPDGTLQPPLELPAGLPASGLVHLDLDGDHFSELFIPSSLGYSVLRNRTQR